nr:MAG TPA: hypothetical protein [Caudoviricetes sp.]
MQCNLSNIETAANNQPTDNRITNEESGLL